MIQKALLLTATLALSSSVMSAALVWTAPQNFSNSDPFNYTDTITIAKYNGPHALKAVRFSLTGNVNGSQKADNNAASGGTLTMRTSAEMILSYNFGFGDITLVTTVPTQINTQAVTADDGGANFTGSDSAVFLDVSATQTETADWDDADLLWSLISSAFSGAGSINLKLTGEADSGATGTGSVLQEFVTAGSTTGYVQYAYDSPVPEPGTYAMLGGGLAVLGLLGRRLRA